MAHKKKTGTEKPAAADFERARADERKRTRDSRNRPKTGLVRKVIARDDFGLCVLLPKTAWAKLPPRGKARVQVDGKARQVTVQSEQCDCQGTGIHEHRFLSLPKSAGMQAGQRVVITFSPSP